MTYAQLIDAIRYRWKGISSTDPDEESLHRLVLHGLQDIQSRCPMAFIDMRGRLERLPDETDFVKDWDGGGDVPLDGIFYESIIAFCLWKLYVRDQNDVRDQSIAAAMRRDYLESLGLNGDGNGQ